MLHRIIYRREFGIVHCCFENAYLNVMFVVVPIEKRGIERSSFENVYANVTWYFVEESLFDVIYYFENVYLNVISYCLSRRELTLFRG
jgi:hypothetical protein